MFLINFNRTFKVAEWQRGVDAKLNSFSEIFRNFQVDKKWTDQKHSVYFQ